jgi:hypothetical protein
VNGWAARAGVFRRWCSQPQPFRSESTSEIPMNDVEDLLLNATGGRTIAFNANFARICGCVKTGLFLSQAMYWQKRVGKREWFYKTQKEWEIETMLSRSEQDLVRKKLKSLGLLKERLAGLPARMHFQVDVLQLADKLQQSSLQETDKLDCDKPATESAGYAQTCLSETDKPYKEAESTSESTPKTTNHKRAGNSQDRQVSRPPDWLPLESWAGFMEMRKSCHRPLTPRAQELIIKKLAKLRAEGHDPARVLDQSVERGWQGIFPIKDDYNGNGNHNGNGRAQPSPSASQRRSEHNASVLYEALRNHVGERVVRDGGQREDGNGPASEPGVLEGVYKTVR